PKEYRHFKVPDASKTGPTPAYSPLLVREAWCISEMEQEKPFKTIEVIDSRTSQICKVACMSCIRGHRTTSCGIPVCRTKIFWTVKRPGRPSNSCTCRYGATGGCKCVVARSACTHKSKKGEKRSGECRCDEQGRYCCLLDPDHWSTLVALGKPTVHFFPTREALEAKQAALAQTPLPSNPAFSAIDSPALMHSGPGTPCSNGHVQPMRIISSPYNGYPPSQSTTLTPRFGMMGIGPPLGSQDNVPPDVLTWEGQAPTAPQEFHPMFQSIPQEQQSCCQSSTPSVHNARSPRPEREGTYDQPTSRAPTNNGPNDTMDHNMSDPLSPQMPPAFNFERLRADYVTYQLPSAICQNCGLNGCTCKNCPPPFQSYGTGSWAQCCGRKHARDVQPSPAPIKIARTDTYGASIHSQGPEQQQSESTSHAHEAFPPSEVFRIDNHGFEGTFGGMELLPSAPQSNFNAFDLDDDSILPEGTQHLDISDFLTSDLVGLNQSIGIGSHSESSARDGRENEAGGGDGGSGGCCCR
ncbi:hypothetical protein AC579_1097, partial [Pseudocercospora musae]